MNDIISFSHILGNKRMIISEQARHLAEHTFAQNGPEMLAMLLTYLQATGTNRTVMHRFIWM